ncbi:MAG: anaerobic ribonucleoside-triphosphate reductase activating protein [Bacteroidales bacterium]|nr:anaerobic ribonucleoside-triphosphate reductase activating protein [Bacteroidales bacterium]
MLKYVNVGIVFQEIPDEVTLAINISNCPCRCPGCHSSYLWNDVGIPLTTDVLDEFVGKFGTDITCICFMGGDAEPEYVSQLAGYLHQAHPNYRVGWYSGRLRIASTACKRMFDYIKVGPYIAHLGSLKCKTTNQRLYQQVENHEFKDITYRFWSRNE